MKTQYDELLTTTGNKLAVEWWNEMENKVGKDYTKDLAKCFANGLLALVNGELETDLSE